MYKLWSPRNSQIAQDSKEIKQKNSHNEQEMGLQNLAEALSFILQLYIWGREAFLHLASRLVILSSPTPRSA